MSREPLALRSEGLKGPRPACPAALAQADLWGEEAKIDYGKKGTLVLPSLLEDLGGVCVCSFFGGSGGGGGGGILFIFVSGEPAVFLFLNNRHVFP